jgi:hypothetical protein
MSAHSGISVEELETGAEAEGFQQLTAHFALSHGFRPTTDQLDQHLAEFEVLTGTKPDLVCIDYSSLMSRNKYDGGEVQRISRLIEGLQQWTKHHEIVTIALHQVGRLDEGTGLRHHGDTPGSLAQLKYGGEEYGDIVMGTYRPALEPFGNMRLDMARQFKGDKFDLDEWEQAKYLVKKYRPYTFLQLLKNRPGTRLHEQGVMLESIGESMQMKEAVRNEDDVRAGL